MKRSNAGLAGLALPMLLANEHMARGNLVAAETELRRIVQQQPRSADALNLLSVIANSTGRSKEAIDFAHAALAVDARQAEFHFSLGRALKSAEQFEEALQAYERALELRPRYIEAMVSLGIALRLLGRLDEAIEWQRRALRLQPDYAPALSNLGNALAQRIGSEVGLKVTAEDLRHAEDAQRRALALEPKQANHLHNLGVLMKLTGRSDESSHFLNSALAIDSSRLDTCMQFGDLLMSQMRFDLSAQLFAKWLEDNTHHPSAMLGLASSLNELGRTEEALEWLDRVSRIEPDSVQAAYLRGRIEEKQFDATFDSRRALETYRRVIEARPSYFEAVCSYLLTLCYIEEDPAQLAVEHRARIAGLTAVETLPAVENSARVAGRLRIGFLSQDLKRHSVAYFLEGLLEAIDRKRFEVHLYKTNPTGDGVTDRLKALASSCVESAHLSDALLADRIRRDKIDILVDLAGLTSGARIGMCEQRPAPCQITYLGYPTSTGATCFDFRISDAVIDPEAEPALGTEPVLRCKSTMFCYRPGEAPEVAPLPALQRRFVTFGSFNNLSKVTPHTLRLWHDVLQAVPYSRLLLKSQAFLQRGNREFFADHFSDLGIARERIVLQPLVPEVQLHLAAYGEIDIGLDCFPYNGATTTCEALWMGVPVVSLAGRTHPSRMGASILSACGLGDCVVHDDAGYVARAAALATDLSALAALRSGMRERLQRSPLLDKANFARSFESLLEQAWQQVLGRTTDAAPA